MSKRTYHNEEHAGPPSGGAGTDPNEFRINKKQVKYWDVAELATFFNIAKLPEGPINLDKTTKIFNVERFVSSHLETIKKHNGNKTYQPYYDRLMLFKKIIENKK